MSSNYQAILEKVRSAPEPNAEDFSTTLVLFDHFPEGERKDNLRAWCERIHGDGVCKKKAFVYVMTNADALGVTHPETNARKRQEQRQEQDKIMMNMMEEFIETGAHYDEELCRQFPLFRGAPPPGHPYPQAWAGAAGHGRDGDEAVETRRELEATSDDEDPPSSPRAPPTLALGGEGAFRPFTGAVHRLDERECAPGDGNPAQKTSAAALSNLGAPLVRRRLRGKQPRPPAYGAVVL